MLLKIVKRAALLFLALLGIGAAAISAFLLYWYIAHPCPPGSSCYFRLVPAGDGLSASAELIAVFLLCLLVSWLSFKFRRPDRKT